MRVRFNIKEIREKRYMSLSTLERKSGVSRSHLNYIEHNEKMPTLIVVIKIAKGLGVSILDLYKVEF